MQQAPAQQDLVLLGGGHANALALRMLAMDRPDHTRITLVSPEPLAPYSGMLPGLVAGHYQVSDTHIDLMQLCQWAGARFVQQAVVHIDTDNQQLQLADGSTLGYDWLSINVGGIPVWDQVVGAAEHAIPVKPVSTFFPRWNRFLDQLARQPREQRAHVTVVGGGAGGTELVLAMAHAVARRGLDVALTLVTRTFLDEYNDATRRHARQALDDYGIHLHEGVSVQQVRDGTLQTDNGDVPFDSLFWCLGVRAPAFLAASNLQCHQDGFVEVDASLRSLSHRNVFAAGDCAWQVNDPAKRAGVYAVRQAKVLADNLRNSLHGNTSLRLYTPQKNFLSLLSLGDKRAVAYRNGISLAGARMWRLKDHIDRKFMRKLNALPEKPAMPATNVDEVRCAGCGSKIGDEALRHALQGLDAVQHDDILAGLGAREDASVIRWQPDALLVQSHDYFPAFVDDPFLFGRIAALHSLSDVHARNAQPHSALATACVPVNHPRLQGRDLSRLMQGALLELNRVSCALVGGHSIEGPQLAAGFTINAAINEKQLLGKRGAAPGDKLLLSKPLGSGILLAAMMRPRAVGQYLDALFEQMLISNAVAATLFHRHGARAVTDVTGFGLLGHLLEMCDASGRGAQLELESLPVLPGVLTVLQQGISSTLRPANDAMLIRCDMPARWFQHPLLGVLTDPQTSGGLLAAVPPENVEACVQACKDAGQQVWCIGSVIPGDGVRLV